MKLPYAEDINYFRTSKVSPDSWIDNAATLIENLGGKVYTHAFGVNERGASAYMVMFVIGGDEFKLVWPVLPCKAGNEVAAKRQAATLLYHDVKARCLTALIKGTREAFFNYLLLPDGRTAAEASIPELMKFVPLVFSGVGIRQLEEGGG